MFSGFNFSHITDDSNDGMTTFYIYYCIIGCGTGWIPLFYVDATDDAEAFKKARETRELSDDEAYCAEKEPMKHHGKLMWKESQDWKNAIDKNYTWSATIL